MKSYSDTRKGSLSSERESYFPQKSVVAFTATEDRARLRAAADRLRACGIDNADKVLRLGAAAMAERCADRFPDQPRLLARVILDGGVIYDEQAGGRRESASDLLRALG